MYISFVTTRRVVMIGIVGACVMGCDLVFAMGLSFGRLSGPFPFSLEVLPAVFLIDIPALVCAGFKGNLAALIIASSAGYLTMSFAWLFAHDRPAMPFLVAVLWGLPVVGKFVLAGLLYGGRFARKPGLVATAGSAGGTE